MRNTAPCVAIATRGRAIKRAFAGLRAFVLNSRLIPAAVVFFCVLTPAGALRAQPLRAAPVVKPTILRTVRHDPAAFTQGLLCIDTVLYESAGLVGRSSLRRVCASTGEVTANIPVPYVFAEGLAFFRDELVQLTWKDGYAIRYEYPSLKTKPVSYKYTGEGWGLTNDAKSFIMSNGTDTLYFRNDKFEITRKIPVTLNGKPLIHLNELEYVNGRIYANVWFMDFIAEISPVDGRVTRVIDCSELVGIEMPGHRDNVFNGIAYCQASGEWYLTGKRWRHMFVVRIAQ